LALAGGIRASLLKGDIVYGDLVASTPFENLVYSVELPGKAIKEALEFAFLDETSKNLLQVSGLKVVFDLSREANNRVVSIDVLCRICENNIPKYEPIDLEAFYRVAMPSYLAEGGDHFSMIPTNFRNLIYGPRDIDALTDYITKHSPIIKPPMSGRIMFV
jgi:5'-nucleotidase